MRADCRDYLIDVAVAAASMPLDAVRELRRQVAEVAHYGRCVYVVGNGGSATVADHFALGLTLNVLREGGTPCRAVSLGANAPALSGAANDFGYHGMFAMQLRALARPADLLVALSASGSSENVVRAMDEARSIGMRTAAVVGRAGRVSERADVKVVVGTDEAAICEDVTMMLLHWVYGQFMAPAAEVAPC